MGKLLDSRLSVFNVAIDTTSTSQSFRNSLQYKINDEFENAPDVYDIKEELIIGTGIFTDVIVRITHVINDKSTGEKLGDDWRNLIFKDITHIYGLGHKYQFNDYTWLIVNTDKYKYVTASCIIRRCNNILKWYNEEGKLIEEPCIVDYFKFTSLNNVEESKYLRVGDNIRYILLQNNDENYRIERDKRFFIGKLVYRVVNFDEVTKSGLYELTLEEHQFNESTDDMTNKICNAYGNTTYTLTVLTDTLSLSTGQTSQLVWEIKYGDVVVTDKTVIFESNSSLVSTVNNLGLVTAIANGSTTIRCSLSGNEDIYDEVSIEVVSSPVSNISEEIEGSDSITINEYEDYSIYKFNNTVDTGNTYTFSLVGSGAILFDVTGNTCKINAENIQDISITLKAVNNVSGDIFNKSINIIGYW